MGPQAAVLLALAAAVTFGCADFCGGRATDRLGAALTVIIVQILGITVGVALVFWQGSPLPAWRDVGLGVLAGLADGIALMTLYLGLAKGRMSVVAPVNSLVSVLLPVVGEIVLVRSPTPVQLGGIGLAVLAGLLFSRTPSDPTGDRPLRTSLVLGIAGGAAFGVTNLSLGLMAPEAALPGLVIMRLTALGVALATAAFQRRGDWTDRRGLGFALAAGLLDGLGLTCYVLAATAGMIGVASAILSLYAGVTVLLGVVVMRERIGPPQLAGLLASAVSVLLLAR